MSGSTKMLADTSEADLQSEDVKKLSVLCAEDKFVFIVIPPLPAGESIRGVVVLQQGRLPEDGLTLRFNLQVETP